MHALKLALNSLAQTLDADCRDQVHHYCQEKLMPRVLLANRNERTLTSSFHKANFFTYIHDRYFSYLHVAFKSSVLVQYQA